MFLHFHRHLGTRRHTYLKVELNFHNFLILMCAWMKSYGDTGLKVSQLSLSQWEAWSVSIQLHTYMHVLHTKFPSDQLIDFQKSPSLSRLCTHTYVYVIDFFFLHKIWKSDSVCVSLFILNIHNWRIAEQLRKPGYCSNEKSQCYIQVFPITRRDYHSALWNVSTVL